MSKTIYNVLMFTLILIVLVGTSLYFFAPLVASIDGWLYMWVAGIFGTVLAIVIAYLFVLFMDKSGSGSRN